jgi:hypothetical protein
MSIMHEHLAITTLRHDDVADAGDAMNEGNSPLPLLEGADS